MSTAIVEPKLTVKIPDVKLRVEDVGYLKSLANEDDVRCAIPSSRLERLRMLGLVKTGSVPPSSKVREEASKKIAEMKAQAHSLLDVENWAGLRMVCFSLDKELRRLEPRTADVISAAGRQLLEKGSVTVKAVGCGRRR